jgi:hypothetical protein
MPQQNFAKELFGAVVPRLLEEGRRYVALKMPPSVRADRRVAPRVTAQRRWL